MAKKRTLVLIDEPADGRVRSAALRHGHPGRDCNSKCPTLERSRRTGNVKRPQAASIGDLLAGWPLAERLDALPVLERLAIMHEMIEAVNAAAATLDWIGSALRGSGTIDSESVINSVSKAAKGIARQTGLTIDRKGWGKVATIVRQDAKRCNAIIDRLDQGRIESIKARLAAGPLSPRKKKQ